MITIFYKNCSIFINKMKNNICYDIKTEHQYNVDTCCILIQMSIHLNLLRVVTVTTGRGGAYRGGHSICHTACFFLRHT